MLLSHVHGGLIYSVRALCLDKFVVYFVCIGSMCFRLKYVVYFYKSGLHMKTTTFFFFLHVLDKLMSGPVSGPHLINHFSKSNGEVLKHERFPLIISYFACVR